jgi:streptogramin lyase
VRLALDRVAAGAVLVVASVVGAQEAADPVAAERQYRLAQRLGADGSPDAPAAFERVVALAPHGPLADDALVDLARLAGSPDWPEDLGALDAARAASARVTLEKVLDAHADGDRVLEARYRLALIRMAPIPSRDAARARQDLIALASNPSRERWVVASRYALGFLDEQAGAGERAAGAFARIVVERPESDVAPRARAGFARTLLAGERFGDAAGWLQDAVESGVPPVVHAEAQRDLALREVFRERDPKLRWTAVAAPLPTVATTRGASLLATAADGRLVVFDRKNGTVQAFDAKGAGSPPVPLADVTAIATDPFGRVFVATRAELHRWDASGPTVILPLGNFGAPSAIAVDASGSVFLADKKGDRIARWVVGTPGPVVVRESKGAGVTALAVSNGRLIAAEEKTGRLVAVFGPGAGAAFGNATFRRPVALAADDAGRVSVLDEKAGTVTRLSPSGEIRDTLTLDAGGVSRPLALATAPDGAVRILDGSTGAVAVAP